MAKVITMGEIMLRLSTPNNEKFIQADEFDINYGGGEANVAVSLANYGHDAEFVTAVPDNEIGECAVAALRKYNVATNHIAKCGERLGIYYLESGSSMRPSKVVYDRAHSSISTATEADFDFDDIFKDADWFHFTGITPAVSDSAAELTEKALIAAKKHGVKVSVDLNFRKKLWSSEKAQKVMTNLMKYVDVCIGNEEDAELVLGFKPGETDLEILDEIWYIYAGEDVRRERLKTSRGYSDEKIDAIMASQLSEEEFRKYCSVVIDNSKALTVAQHEIDKRLEEYLCQE